MSARYRLFRWTLTVIAVVLFGLRCHGTQRVAKEGPLIVSSNHHSLIDPFIVALAVPRKMYWMAKKDSFFFPLKQILEFFDAFPVDRKGGKEGLRIALRLLSEGRTIGIFPQGTRRKTRSADEDAKTGAIMLARRGGANIVPVYVGRYPTPLGRLRGQRLEVFVGETFALEGEIRGKDYHRAANELLERIFFLGKKGES